MDASPVALAAAPNTRGDTYEDDPVPAARASAFLLALTAGCAETAANAPPAPPPRVETKLVSIARWGPWPSPAALPLLQPVEVELCLDPAQTVPAVLHPWGAMLERGQRLHPALTSEAILSRRSRTPGRDSVGVLKALRGSLWTVTPPLPAGHEPLCFAARFHRDRDGQPSATVLFEQPGYVLLSREPLALRPLLPDEVETRGAQPEPGDGTHTVLSDRADGRVRELLLTPLLNLTETEVPPLDGDVPAAPVASLQSLRGQRIDGETPHLPREVKAGRAGQTIQGTYKLCMGTDGVVNYVTPITPIPGADEAIIQALKTWRFKAQPVPVCAAWALQFIIEAPPPAPSSAE